MTQRYETEAWLGDDHGLTDEQIDELTATADEIAERYPDPDDQAERDAALTAAYRIMAGQAEALVEELARERVNAREAELLALAGLRQAALTLIPGDETQAGFARRAGVDRMAVRDWLGLRKPGERNLEESRDPAYVVGRLLGVANHMALGRPRTPEHLGHLTDKLFEETMPINPDTLGQLRRLIDKQMHGPLSDLYRTVYQAVLEDIDGRLTGLPTLGPGTKTRLSLILGFDHQRAALYRAGDTTA